MKNNIAKILIALIAMIVIVATLMFASAI